MNNINGSSAAPMAEVLPDLGLTAPPSSVGILTLITASKMWSTPMLATMFILFYVALCSALRFRKEKAILRKYRYTGRESLANMSNDDAQAINQNIMLYEFPKMYMASLQFAIFKTYSFESVSKLIVATKSFSDAKTAPKRYEDTVILFGQFQLNPPTSELCIKGISRMNILHDKYKKAGKISNADFLYTLSVCVTEPIKFINAYEWRQLNELEVNAIGTFWKSIGDAMDIQYEGYLSKNSWRDGIEWVEDIAAWAKSYELEAMKPALTNKEPAKALVDMLIWHVPNFAKGFAFECLTVLMGDRVRDAFYYPEPSLIACFTAYSTLLIRRFFLRYLTLPRFSDVKYYTLPDSKTGRIQHLDYLIEPYYLKPTFWNRWGPEGWFTWALGGNLPGFAGERLKSDGFLFEDLGPAARSGKRAEDTSAWEARLRKERPSGCPFSSAY